MPALRFVVASTALLALTVAAAPAQDLVDCEAPSVLPMPAACAWLLPPPARFASEGPRVPGDTAYFKNNYPSTQEVKTAPLPTLTFTVVGANAQPLFGLAFEPTATTLYAVDNTSRQLGTVDLTTGAFTAIGAINPDPGVTFTVTGLTFDPTTGTAYLVLTNAMTANLYTIDVGTAALTLVGPLTGFAYTIDIAVDNSGQMWGHEIGLDVLISIDKTTGAGTTVGPTGLAASFAQGMMYDPSDDTLYGCAFLSSPALQGELVSFDRATGAATILDGPVPDELECAVQVAAEHLPFVDGFESGDTSAWSFAVP